MKIKPVFVIFLVFSFLSCDDESILYDGAVVYFSHYYINYAWGYNHSGFFVDNEGNLKKFSQPENWHFLTNEGYISASKMEENLKQCTITGSVSKKELSNYVYKMHLIVEGNYSERKNEMFDAGSVASYCYKYDRTTQMYKAVLLDVYGDWAQTNYDKNAQSIDAWLKSIKVN